MPWNITSTTNLVNLHVTFLGDKWLSFMFYYLSLSFFGFLYVLPICVLISLEPLILSRFGGPPGAWNMEPCGKPVFLHIIAGEPVPVHMCLSVCVYVRPQVFAMLCVCVCVILRNPTYCQALPQVRQSSVALYTRRWTWTCAWRSGMGWIQTGWNRQAEPSKGEPVGNGSIKGRKGAS